MKTIKINVPLTVHYELLPPSVDGEATQKRIESRWGAVSVSVSGSREAVDHMLSVCSTNNPPTLIQRALSALGYVVGDHAKDVEQFSRWVDHLAEFSQSEEALELWTNATLAGLPTGKTVDESSQDAQAVVAQRMRLFPPTPNTGVDDGPTLPGVIGVDVHISAMKVANETIRLWVDLTGCKTPKDAAVALARLREWEKAARQRGWNSPLDLRGRTAADDAELGQWRDAAKANGITSPNELVQSANINFGQFVDRKVTRDWQEATGCNAPEEASRVKADKIAQWQAATGCNTPEVARLRIGQLNRFLDDWQIKSGVASPDALIEKFRITEDAWKEATGAMDTHSAYKRIQELESKLLSYAGEIDALRKASSTMVRDPALEMRACDAEHEKRVSAERELAKVRAELQSKCREAQTAKERADENAREMVKRGALLDKIAEALGCDFNHESLPEHVADMKRAYDNVNDCLVGPDNLVNETKEIASILVSQIKDAGIESAAGAIAGRSVHLSVSWAKTMQAREILLASPGESIVDAAKRTMDRCANLEGQIVADDNRTDELRKILHAKEGESIVDAAKRAIAEAKAAVDGATQDAKSYWSMVVSGWEQCTGCATPEEAREKIASAIIPLPKPEKVEPGQKWAFVMTATSGTEDGNVYLVGRFRNAWGNHYGALTYDIRTGFYLGT